MKKFLTLIFILFNSFVFACGGDGWYGMSFYNLFLQTNIKAEEFYPFLREEYHTFYGDSFENESPDFYTGNINLWKEILKKWSEEDIKAALYGEKPFNWNDKRSKLDKRAKIYIDFAKECNTAFSQRKNRGSWDYDELQEEKTVDTQKLLAKANQLLEAEKNEQLRARYQYQIIRILHYSKLWDDAIRFYEANAKDLHKNEIYYYILDQVAGCFYSIGDYEKAAYLFTNIVNESIDRKKSAYLSFNLCSFKNVEGREYMKNNEDEKNLLLIKSLRNFSDEIANIEKFIALDANDQRVELLFMRALSNVERTVWPNYQLGLEEKTLPNLSTENNYPELLKIAEAQAKNSKVTNRDFWQIASSYLSFIEQDITTAKNKLKKVNAFATQKQALAVLYEVFSWDTITAKNEERILKIIKNIPTPNSIWEPEYTTNFRHFILDRIGHLYYKNNEIAKAFLVHNKISDVDNISSLALLNTLEKFYNQPTKNEYEKELIKIASDRPFLDYINYQKGLYYIIENQPEKALSYFEKSNDYDVTNLIPNTIFSNNFKECFSCDVSQVMDDKVYLASAFNFIKPFATKQQLAESLIELHKLTNSETGWKAKLASYLLGNFYFNISNTGYYRGILNNKTNGGDYNYIQYADDNYRRTIVADRSIKEKSGYNLANIGYFDKTYYDVSNIAATYYEKTIAMSTDKELNARCLYLIAKCELNDYYNNGNKPTFEIKSEYTTVKLPLYKSFKKLKEEYSDTNFHNMIIKECSYFRHYSASY